MAELEENMYETEDEILTEEDIAAYKARGPFVVAERFSKPYQDVLGRTQRIHSFVIEDKDHVEVARSKDRRVLDIWAKELTEKGYIED